MAWNCFRFGRRRLRYLAMVSRHSKKGDGQAIWCLCTLPILIFPFIVIFLLHRSFSADEFLQHSGFKGNTPAMAFRKDMRLLKEQNEFFETLLNMTKAPATKPSTVSDVVFAVDSGRRDPPADSDPIQLHRDEESSDHDGKIVIVTPEPDTGKTGKVTFVPREDEITGHALLSAFFEQVVPDYMAGKLNVHTWQGICGPYVEQLRHSPLFPRFPYMRKFLHQFRSHQEESDFGERIFGFIHPEKQGFHEFAITSDDTSELWLSSDSNPKKSRLIAAVYSASGAAWTTPYNFKKYPIQVSRKIALKSSRKYYIEALHKQSKGRSHVQVFWKEPGSQTFKIIRGKYLSLFVDDRDKHEEGIMEDIDFHSYAPPGIPSHSKRKLDSSVKKFLYKC